MKKFGKILLWTVGLLAVLFILAVVGLKLFFPAEKVRAMAIEKGSAALGRDISVESLDLSVWGGLGVVLQNVRVSNPEGFAGPEFFTAENIDLKLQLWPLIAGDFRVDRLIIENPSLNLVKTESGKINYAFELSDTPEIPAEVAALPPEGQVSALVISFDELEVENGEVTYLDDSSGVQVDLSGLNLSSVLLLPREGEYHSTGRLQIDSARLVSDEALPNIALNLNYELVYQSAVDRLTLKRAALSINDLRADLSGEVNNLLGDLSAKVNVRSYQGQVTDLLSLLAPAQRARFNSYTIAGGFSFDVDAEYSSVDNESLVEYTGTSALTDLVVTGTEVPGTLRFDRCLIDFEPDNMRMTIEQGSFDGRPLKGHLVVDDFNYPIVSGELAGFLDLKLVEPFLPAEGGHHLAGLSQFALKVSGPAREVRGLKFSGNLSVDSGSYNSNLIPEPIEFFSLSTYLDENLVNIRALSCGFPSGQLNITGRLYDLVPYLLADSTTVEQVAPSLEATVQGVVDLGIARAYLPEVGDPQLSGQMSLDTRIFGDMQDLSSFRSYGEVEISNAAYSDTLLPEPMEQFEASLRLRPDTIEIVSMTARFTSSDLSLTGNLIRPFPYLLPILDIDRDSLPQPMLIFEINSHRFDVDRLFPEAVPGAGLENGTLVTSVDSVSTIILPAIEGHGTVAADTVIYSQVELTEVRGKIRMRDRKIECYDATARVYTGAVSGKTTIDLSDFNNPRYTGEFEATQIEADDFISRFTKFGGHLFGKGNMNGTYNALGWEPDAFLNSLTLDGDVTMRDGRLVTSGVVLDGLTRFSSFLGKSFKKEQPLRNLANKISVANGRVTLDDIVGTLGDLGDFKVNGSYGFDNTLEYTGQLILTRELSRQFGGNGNRLSLPLTISGTVTDPKFKLDFSTLAKKAGENLIKDALNGLFKKK